MFIFYLILPHTYFHCTFYTLDGLYGNLLAVADEEGSVRLMDTTKPASKSLVKGVLLFRGVSFSKLVWWSSIGTSSNGVVPLVKIYSTVFGISDNRSP